MKLIQSWWKIVFPVHRTVEVWGKRYTVTTRKKSKSVWIAVGDYMGKRIEVEDRSEATAIKGWRDAARFKGN